MRKNPLSSIQFLSKFICILLMVLIQFPAVTLAFNPGKFNLLNNDFLHTAKSNSALLANPVVSPSAVFSNSTSFTVADAPSGGRGVASIYPTPITVSGLSGTVSDINVTITGITTTRPRDLDSHGYLERRDHIFKAMGMSIRIGESVA